MLRRKRTTGPDVSGPFEPVEPPVKIRRRLSGGSPARLARAVGRARARARQIKHRPTLGQLRLMARFDGRQPSTYRLDRAENWLPECCPTDSRRQRRAALHAPARARSSSHPTASASPRLATRPTASHPARGWASRVTANHRRPGIAHAAVRPASPRNASEGVAPDPQTAGLRCACPDRTRRPKC